MLKLMIEDTNPEPETDRKGAEIKTAKQFRKILLITA